MNQRLTPPKQIITRSIIPKIISRLAGGTQTFAENAFNRARIFSNEQFEAMVPKNVYSFGQKGMMAVNEVLADLNEPQLVWHRSLAFPNPPRDKVTLTKLMNDYARHQNPDLKTQRSVQSYIRLEYPDVLAAITALKDDDYVMVADLPVVFGDLSRKLDIPNQAIQEIKNALKLFGYRTMSY